MNPTYRVYPKVTIGAEAVIGDFCILGCPPRGYAPGELPLIIGARAVIGAHTVIYAGSVIGDDFRAGSSAFIREFCQIGDRMFLADHGIVEANATVGTNVRVEPFGCITHYAVVESDCCLGADSGLADVLHPLCPKARECMKGPTLGPGVVLGGRALIGVDLLIGEGVMVQPGSLVVGPVPPNTVVAGSPAKAVGRAGRG